MGVTQSTQKNNEIEKQLKLSNEKEGTVLKLLLLGAGESGKTTVFKQLLLNKGGGFDDNQIKMHSQHVCDNIVTGMFNLLKGAKEFKHEIEGNAELEAAATLIRQEKSKAGDKELELKCLTDELAEAVLTLWASPNIQAVYPKCSQLGKFNLPDTYPIMMERLQDYPTWGGPEWTPTPDDCLLIRVRTTGVIQQQFVDSNMTFRVIDVGGQRGERRKWLHLFEGVTALIFVASMAEYDQTLFEDSDFNRLQESITLFKSLATNNYFENSSFIVILNKMDLFKKKFYDDKIPLNFSGLYPDAPLRKESDPECEEAKEWFRMQLMNAVGNERRFSTHFTTALEQESMKTVIDMFVKHVLERFIQAETTM